VEDVEGKAGDQGITQGVLLPEESRVVAGRGRMPGAPLVYNEADLPLRIEAIQDRPLLGHELLHPRGFLQELIPLFVRVLGRSARSAAVVMRAPAVDAPVAAQ